MDLVGGFDGRAGYCECKNGKDILVYGNWETAL